MEKMIVFSSCRKFIAAFCLLGCGILISNASAETSTGLSFTFSGLMTGTNFGYTNNQFASFTFTLSPNASFSVAHVDSSHSNDFYYGSQQVGNPAIFSSISGTGLTTNNGSLSNSYYDAGPGTTPYFHFLLYVAGTGPNGSPIDEIVFSAATHDFNLSNVTDSSPFLTPYEYLKAIAGSYNTGVFDLNLFYNYATFNSMNVQNVTIVDTVPEPSTYALLGLGAIALLFVARRKRA
jgi:hypothetical protein